MNNQISFNIYEITDDYQLDEYVLKHFSGEIEGYPVILDFFDAPDEYSPEYFSLKINVTLSKAEDQSEFAAFFKALFESSDIEKDIDLQAHHITIQMDMIEGFEKDLKVMLKALPTYFKERQYKAACSRCGHRDNTSFYQSKWVKAEFLCTMCKDDLIQDNEKRLEILSENAKKNKKKMKQASASFFVGANGKNIIPAVLGAWLVAFVFIFIMGYFLSIEILQRMVAHLPLEVSELTRYEQRYLLRSINNLPNFWIWLSGSAPVAGMFVFRFFYGIGCRKGLLIFGLGHLVMHIVTLIVSYYRQLNKVLAHFDFNNIPLEIYTDDLLGKIGLQYFQTFIPVIVVYSIFFLLVWKNIN